MKNNVGIDDSVIEGFEEFLDIGLSSSADIFSKLLNAGVTFEADEIISEKAAGLTSFGTEPGVVISLNISGALTGKAAVVIENVYAKKIVNILMNMEDDGSEADIDEMSMGTVKELVGQMAAAFADSVTDFFGSSVKITADNIYDLSEECEEIADIFGCPNDSNVYSVVSDFDIADHFSGKFNIELDVDTFNFTASRLSMTSGGGGFADFGGNMGVNAAVDRRSGRPVSVVKNSINVQSAQFPNFSNQDSLGGISLLQGNMDLLMDVPLNVTIEIGKTRKKMRDIMEFSQGTVIDLEKQAGAPVDIVVNGQLIARGDVVVIDDNFAVRITEIVGNSNFVSKE
ncbi:MAG: flagellar motor switch protein FliN [Clostridium sp.]|nr:flagellar motor switch protein FliN [Clostridium sp.]MCM1547561.1 flagellar motor switch protein FliN [Ruminococcus sp.]